MDPALGRGTRSDGTAAPATVRTRWNVNLITKSETRLHWNRAAHSCLFAGTPTRLPQICSAEQPALRCQQYRERATAPIFGPAIASAHWLPTCKGTLRDTPKLPLGHPVGFVTGGFGVPTLRHADSAEAGCGMEGGRQPFDDPSPIDGFLVALRTGISRSDHHIVVPRCERKGQPPYGKRVRDGINPLAPQIYVEKRPVHPACVCLDEFQRIRNGACGTYNLDAEFFEPLREVQCDHVLVFDYEETPSAQIKVSQTYVTASVCPPRRGTMIAHRTPSAANSRVVWAFS